MIGVGVLAGHFLGEAWVALFIPVGVVWTFTFLGSLIEDYD